MMHDTMVDKKETELFKKQVEYLIKITKNTCNSLLNQYPT